MRFSPIFMALTVSAHPFLTAERAALPQSKDGKCGAASGETCLGSTHGNSCSAWNFCGNTEKFSGSGCQPKYGACDGSPAPANPHGSKPDLPKAPTAPKATASVADGTVPGIQQAAKPDASATSSPKSKPSSSSNESKGKGYDTVLNGHAPGGGFISDIPGVPAFNPKAGSPPPHQGKGGPPDTPYKMFSGNGDSGWPSESKWLSFDELWDANMWKIKTSCSTFGLKDNSPEEISDMKDAVESVSKKADVDKTYVLAVLMQESQGCVRVPTTAYSVSNPGLFQSHAGTGTCNKAGVVSDPCPKSQIVQMVEDGVMGTKDGKGLKQTIAEAKGKGVSKFYQGARIYNSGSIAPSGDLGQGVATHCYASDVANRLLGWTAKSPNDCKLD